MIEPLTSWLMEAKSAGSYREKYSLAVRIMQSADKGPLGEAAACVVISLSDIIYEPIAEAWRLNQAQRFFQLLVQQLEIDARGVSAA